MAIRQTFLGAAALGPVGTASFKPSVGHVGEERCEGAIALLLLERGGVLRLLADGDEVGEHARSKCRRLREASGHSETRRFEAGPDVLDFEVGHLVEVGDDPLRGHAVNAESVHNADGALCTRSPS